MSWKKEFIKKFGEIEYQKELMRHRDQKRFRYIRKFWQGLETDIHHCWIDGTADYTFSCLLERCKHLYEIIDPLIILDGDIYLGNDTFI